jgi:hypothetical protein
MRRVIVIAGFICSTVCAAVVLWNTEPTVSARPKTGAKLNLDTTNLDAHIKGMKSALAEKKCRLVTAIRTVDATTMRPVLTVDEISLPASTQSPQADLDLLKDAIDKASADLPVIVFYYEKDVSWVRDPTPDVYFTQDLIDVVKSRRQIAVYLEAAGSAGDFLVCDFQSGEADAALSYTWRSTTWRGTTDHYEFFEEMLMSGYDQWAMKKKGR